MPFLCTNPKTKNQCEGLGPKNYVSSPTLSNFFFPQFLMLHHMWTSQEGLRIKLHQVCRFFLECKKIIRKSPPPTLSLLKPKWKCIENLFKNNFKMWSFFPPKEQGICDKIFIFHFLHLWQNFHFKWFFQLKSNTNTFWFDFIKTQS